MNVIMLLIFYEKNHWQPDLNDKTVEHFEAITLTI